MNEDRIKELKMELYNLAYRLQFDILSNQEQIDLSKQIDIKNTELLSELGKKEKPLKKK